MPEPIYTDEDRRLDSMHANELHVFTEAALKERNARLDLIERMARGEYPGCTWVPLTRAEIGLAIDGVATLVQSRDSEYAPLLHKLQDAYEEAKA